MSNQARSREDAASAIGRGGTKVIIEPPVIGRGGTKVIIEPTVLGRGGTKVIIEPPVIGRGGTKVIIEPTVLGRGGTKVIKEPPVIGQRGTKAIMDLPVIGRAGTQVIMEPLNLTCSSINHFLLSGVPGLDDFNFWFGFPLVLLYLVAILGNVTILCIIKVDKELHEPMYIFLFMLSALDILIATTVMPKMLGIFWFDSRAISFDTCLTQMFSIHFLSALESGILVAMAVDRCVALCYPLRYSAILTHKTIRNICLAIVLRGAAGMIPLPLIIKRLPLFKNNLLTHSYCLHQETMKLACADIRVNIIYGLFIALSAMGVDSVFITVSYILIIKMVVCLVAEASLKAISTCSAHICAVFVFYMGFIGIAVVHRYPSTAMPNLHVLFGNIYLLFSPVINPLIYGIKTKQIRSRLSRLFTKESSQRAKKVPAPSNQIPPINGQGICRGTELGAKKVPAPSNQIPPINGQGICRGTELGAKKVPAPSNQIPPINGQGICRGTELGAKKVPAPSNQIPPINGQGICRGTELGAKKVPAPSNQIPPINGQGICRGTELGAKKVPAPSNQIPPINGAGCPFLVLEANTLMMRAGHPQSSRRSTFYQRRFTLLQPPASCVTKSLLSTTPASRLAAGERSVPHGSLSP
ncbi:PREDICTED: olfactory receptor 1L6-like [Nanorana parkeri]|uniref:olfactory receptor 1L6-like n=1 Tax=Nanorana parkeri TaxID=125878 RepID=UPI000854F7B9|nr:PREDICTED: olfactory receptor 1L6-like [Nanorana parkeri]